MTTSRYIIFKLQKTKNKENLERSQFKSHLPKGNKGKNDIRLPARNHPNKMRVGEIFKVFKTNLPI